MAGISTSINIVDRASASLNRITESAYETTSAFNGLSSASDAVFDSSNIQEATQELTAFDGAVQEIEADLQQDAVRMQQLENETEDVREEADRLGSSFGGVGKIIAGLGLGYIIKQQVSEAIEYASDLTEVQNVVDTVFGDASDNVNAWSKTTLDAFGLNELSAKRFAGTLGAMLSSSGLDAQAEEMSLRLTELAGDMASFYNLDAEEAFNKIRSGISGETEPLKQLGINMSVANLEAYALSQGIKTSYNEMSQADQTLLRYAYLMETTANAQGDFARTQDSYANQTKLLKENWSAFTGELAARALPTLTAITQMLNSVVTFISENWVVIEPIMMGFLALLGAYTTALIVTKTAALGHAVAEGARAAAAAMAEGATFGATAAQHGFNAALFACPITWIVIAIVALIAGLVALCNWIAEVTGVTESGLGIIVGALTVAGAFIWNLFVGLVDLVLGCLNAFLNPFLKVANFIGNVFTSPISSVIYLFQGLADACLGVLQSIAEAMDYVFGSDMGGTIQGWRDDLKDMADDVVKKYAPEETYQELFRDLSLDAEDLGLKRWEYSDAWDKGNEWGDNLADKLGGYSVDDALADVYTDDGAGSVADMLGNIGSDTSDISDGVNISNENLKYLRDIAEKEAINRFTTAEIKVDMTNHNNISSEADLDGIVNALSDGLLEEMTAVAGGVH